MNLARVGGVPSLIMSQRANGLSPELPGLTVDPEEQNVRGVHLMREEGQISDGGGVGATDKRVKQLLKDLRSENPYVGRNAAKVLRKLGAKEAIPALIQALGDPIPTALSQDESTVPDLAWSVLENIIREHGGDREVIAEAIRASLGDPNPAVQEGAAQFLSHIGGSRFLGYENYSFGGLIISELIKAGREKQNKA